MHMVIDKENITTTNVETKQLPYKCYNIQEGCMGLVNYEKFDLFASETDYREWYEENILNE